MGQKIVIEANQCRLVSCSRLKTLLGLVDHASYHGKQNKEFQKFRLSMIRATRLAAVNTALLIRACVRCALVMHMLATQLLGLLGGTRRLGAMLETDPPSQCAAAGKCRSQGRRPRIELSLLAPRTLRTTRTCSCTRHDSSWQRWPSIDGRRDTAGGDSMGRCSETENKVFCQQVMSVTHPPNMDRKSVGACIYT